MVSVSPCVTALRGDPELPSAATDPKRWIRQEVTVGALRDSHLIGASVPVAYGPGLHVVDYGDGGVAHLQDNPLARREQYTVWSYEAQPTPRQLAALPGRYPEHVRKTDLYVEAHVTAPPFAAPDRERRVAQIFATSDRARPYEAFYKTARRIVGDPSNPYAAALELEAWFRSGAFQYDQTPPQSSTLPPLVAFVTQTHRGYCQHFAGAMALMLRYLGIPARVAAGFTSGEYDSSKHEWTVTDHDAHTWVEAWFPRYGWLPFDPTPGRGSLDGTYTASSPHFDLTEELRVRVAFVKAELVAHVRLDPFHAVRAGAPAGEELFRFAVLADVDVARALFARVPGDRGLRVCRRLCRLARWLCSSRQRSLQFAGVATSRGIRANSPAPACASCPTSSAIRAQRRRRARRWASSLSSSRRSSGYRRRRSSRRPPKRVSGRPERRAKRRVPLGASCDRSAASCAGR